MFEFFNQIVGFFETIFGIIGSFFNALGYLLMAVVEIVSWPVVWAPWLPAVIHLSMMIVFALGVAKFILGR